MSGACFLFEGRMERAGVPLLLVPVWEQFHRVGVKLRNGGSFEGRPDLLKGLPKVAAIMAEEDAHTFALCDFHPRHPRWPTVEAFREGVTASLPRSARAFLHLHFAMHDIESWILGDRQALAEMLRIPEDKIAANAEEIDLDNPPKTMLRQLFRSQKRQYRETKEGEQLLGRLGVRRVYGRCRFFRIYLDDIVGTFKLDLAAILSAGE